MNETNQECQNEQEILNESEIEVEEKVSQVEEETSEASKEEEAEAKIAQMKDQLLRTMAELTIIVNEPPRKKNKFLIEVLVT